MIIMKNRHFFLVHLVGKYAISLENGLGLLPITPQIIASNRHVTILEHVAILILSMWYLFPHLTSFQLNFVLNP